MRFDLGEQAGGTCRPRAKHLRFRSLPIVRDDQAGHKTRKGRAHSFRTMDSQAEGTLGPWGIQMVNEVRPASLRA